MINTAEYHLAKYLDSIIKPHIPSEFMLESTSSFLGKLKEFCFKPMDILISFDVVSLFTNVPLEQTINTIADHIYELDFRPPFEKKTFKKLMHIATSGIFMYRDRYFRQVDGVTMGSPLGPTMANFCLADLEAKLLSVDDIFCVFRQNSSRQQFLDKLNCLHPNLKFTSEVGPSILPYLNTTFSLSTTEDGCFTSKVFRKRTYTGLILNFSAVCPQKWKFGLV